MSSLGSRLRRAHPDVATTRDRVCTGGAAGLYALGLGIASVALPLRALSSGYSASAVGILTALTALAQIGARLGMGSWMRRVPDWAFVASSTLLLATSCVMAAVTTSVVPFILAHLFQGASRAFFWTGSQTHVVRDERESVRALASIQLVASIGLLLGPLIAGLIGARSLSLALHAAAALAIAGLVPASLLDRLPVFTLPTKTPPGWIWQRPGVDAGCWAGASAGAWRSILNSYVPIALSQASHSTTTIGMLVSIANCAQIVGQPVVGRLRQGRFAAAFAVGVVTVAFGIALVGLLAESVILAGTALAVSGLGAGLLQTLGPAVASDAVDLQERGQAIATAGTFRATASFVVPLGASALVIAMPVGVVLASAGALMLWPTVYVRRLARHLG